MPYESAPPFIIIVGAFCAMAGIQYLGNDVIYGKPKPMGQDDWDKKLVERDVRILEETRLKKEQDKKKKVSGYAELNKGRKWFGIL
mmetsp:Transcript_8348/g.15440  ORF Transcript_8348/g.15440 Transcript_8348/m.15440 type:complete len:86 (-) Transcript_8348:236-493(-)|eukprot:CAMPEP_0182612610 /NCGR_PEP_ID=MMETSP1330-20130603/19525_1 /TAXON_ID=464278 /ORGANISM="Picochlorum sp., Strain RCC944" /LENGTH=85 /DNA_ID=CAMNT_0024832177 /DNA_START=36 /DNA_END=293 /DNA_ORIENTATION=-